MRYIYWIVNFIRVLIFKFFNKEVIAGQEFVVKNVKVKNTGSNNTVVIGSNCKLTNSEILFYGSNNHITIGDKTNLNGVVFWMGENGNRISIGKDTTIEDNTELAACESSEIIIGSDCMFSHSILVRTTDSHSIINVDGERLNKAASIKIGNHVWVGLQSLILKGADIPDNCVIGARSVVSKSNDFESQSVIAGMPARCVRKNINWLRDRI